MSQSTLSAPSRPITPVTARIDHEGAPFVRLQSEGGIDNGKLLYEAIKSLPDTLSMGGDFDAHGQPYVFFSAPHTGTKDAIAAHNTKSAITELSNMLGHIATAAVTLKLRGSEGKHAALELRLAIHASERDGGYTVGSLRGPLTAVSRCVRKMRLEAIARKYKFEQPAEVNIQRMRLELFSRLSDAERDRMAELLVYATNGDKKVMFRELRAAIDHVAALADQIVNHPAMQARATVPMTSPERLMSIGKLIRNSRHFDSLLLFARCWSSQIQSKKSALHMRFGYESWVAEINRIASIAIRSERRRSRLLPVRSSEAIVGELQRSPSVRASALGLPKEPPSAASLTEDLGMPSPIIHAFTAYTGVRAVSASSAPASTADLSPMRQASAWASDEGSEEPMELLFVRPDSPDKSASIT